MKLETIKLSGFKSFVDSTTIPIDGNLTAIVGPNGCGKSNIIDAIRWVMGESSAKHLRGGNMADVVFNGSATRKAVSRAFVELVFDNTDDKIGGEYAQYTKLAIKRQVSREGQSAYFLNGSRCRRKDITDLFLGTGLGARSYAIIEQGTISRMVEAKPDDLRVHIEEAAGISKYKERRLETETRMRHTRDNLERLSDLRNEIAQQLNSLQKQANKAEKYTEFKKQQRVFQQHVLAMRWQALQVLIEKHEDELETIASEHNRLFVLHRSYEKNRTDKQVEQKRQQLQLEKNQQQFYQFKTETATLQQSIQHHQQSLQDTHLEIERLQKNATHASSEHRQEFEQLETINQQLKSAEEKFLITQTQQQKALIASQKAQQILQDWQQHWDIYRHESSEHENQSQLQKLKLSQIQQQNQQLEQRLKALQQQYNELTVTSLDTEICILEKSLLKIETERVALLALLKTSQQTLIDQKQQLKSLHSPLHSARSTLQQMSGKITSLDLLQQHALGKDKKNLTRWLAQSQLADNARLLEFLEVETKWETALEIVLSDYLQALCVDKMDEVVPHLETLNKQTLALFESQGDFQTITSSPLTHLTPLLNKVTAPFDLRFVLTGIYCAENLAEAREQVSELVAHESIITVEGFWLGRGWLKTFARDDSHNGILQREKQLRTLKQQQQDLYQQIKQFENQITELETASKQSELKLEKIRQQENALNVNYSTQQAQVSAKKARLEQQQHRLQQLDGDILDIKTHLSENAKQKNEGEVLKFKAESKLKNLKQHGSNLTEKKQALQQQLSQADNAFKQVQQQFHSLQSQCESLRVAKKSANKHLQHLERQQHDSSSRLKALQAKQADILTPFDEKKTALISLNLKKDASEKLLIRQKEQQQSIDKALKELNRLLSQSHKSMEAQKESLNSVRFQQQESQVRQQTFNEQLNELGGDAKSVLKNLTENSNLENWIRQLDDITAKIDRLGAINLTAIDEYTTQSQRKAFLDAQDEDLVTALNTLTQAIEKIDKETRLRFKETFDRINRGLQDKFPKLFGGGKAYLELTQTKSLEAGVNIIARPPGKKNSSIHLLSGGEKALTAVALVFSIFELNPAPFCLLDEVDAPLDDANVERFSKMVTQMSESVQFLFISHNKVTMEIATQLTGVTMKEAGVSRIVAVNIEHAIELAES